MSDSERLKRAWRPVREILKANPAAAATFFFFLANTAGVVYARVLFAQFGVNFFDHAELSDFTMAVFRGGDLTLYTVVWAFLLGVGMVWASARKESTFSQRNVWGGLGLMALSVVGFSAQQGWSDSGSIRYLRNRRIGVFLLPTGPGQPVQLPEAALVGRVGETLFIFDRQSRSTLAIPIARIHHLEYSLETKAP